MIDALREKRYGTAKWRAVRLAVLRRDGYRCFIESCETLATVADHIDPVTPSMPDQLFYSEFNLRASCARHNLVRGMARRFEREAEGLAEPSPRPGPYWLPVRFEDRRG